jgi:hypothetical protein
MGHLPGRSVIRHLAWCALLSLALASCDPAPFDINDGRSPINGVRVYAGSHHFFAEVDDSIGIQAWGYHDGDGWGAQYVKTATWTASDPATLRIVRKTVLANSSAAVLRGLRPGIVLLSATLNGVTGSDSIRVLPKIRELQLKATRTMLSIGDTVEIWLRANDLNGDSIPNLRPLYVRSLSQTQPLLYIGPWPRERYVGNTTGSIVFYTQVANDSTDLTITVVP